MKKIRSRRWLTKVGIMVEEINLVTGEIVCKLFHRNGLTKYWVG